MFLGTEPYFLCWKWCSGMLLSELGTGRRKTWLLIGNDLCSRLKQAALCLTLTPFPVLVVPARFPVVQATTHFADQWRIRSTDTFSHHVPPINFSVAMGILLFSHSFFSHIKKMQYLYTLLAFMRAINYCSSNPPEINASPKWYFI